jgi:hypothetical protein
LYISARVGEGGRETKEMGVRDPYEMEFLSWMDLR